MKKTSLGKILILCLLIVGLHALFIYKATVIVTGDYLWIVRLYITLTGLFLLSRFLVVIFYDDSHDRKFASHQYPRVSFVIAAKNEEDSIYKTIVACMSSDYLAETECIVIDDGSTDNTRNEMLRAQTDYVAIGVNGVRVIVFDRNRGKREGMAEGILAARGEVVIFVDSDSFVEEDAARHIVEHFMCDNGVAAVAGNSGVENEKTNVLTKMQSARYGVSFDLFKACESVFGVVTCCPGCFSAYRRDALLYVLPIWRDQVFLGTKSTFGDDRSLTSFILRNWRVVYCQTAKARTIVPDDYGKFLKQQLRWKKSWIREAPNSGSFMWRKNILASSAFYINLVVPMISPLVVFNSIVIGLLFFFQIPIVFLIGVLSLSFLYGLFYFWQSSNKVTAHTPLNSR